MKYSICQTELGWLGLAFGGQGLCGVMGPQDDAVGVEEGMRLLGADGPVDSDESRRWGELLRRYASGEAVSFDLPLDLTGGTPFQQAVWRALMEIPRGETRSYRWVAERVGRPGAARAVGQAVGANPLPFVVPCHRVIGGDGGLCGFGGGLPLKKRLLELEGALPATP
ncbi:MAG: methylated-DNA--[protein]-cysteine S-methyltransferase [Dehalococcoidia bacterium]|nr:methylated-DNA--[protein]-cysteine S-methyltransferase [Dehalococcoidia bacterium]